MSKFAKGAKLLGKGALYTPATVNKVFDRTAGVLGTVSGTGLATDGVIRAVKATTKKSNEGPAFWNAYTGRRESGFGIAAVGGVGAAYAIGASYHKEATEGGLGTTSYSGYKHNLQADGVGHRSNAPTLGAGGDLVFGLNNMRRG